MLLYNIITLLCFIYYISYTVDLLIKYSVSAWSQTGGPV